MSASKWKPYPQYKKSNGPTGMLPISWSEVRFRMLFDTQKGKIPSEIHPEALPDSIPYVSMEYLREGTGSQHVIPEQGSVIIEEDDMMILWDGSNAGEVLKSKYGILSSTAAGILRGWNAGLAKSMGLTGARFVFLVCSANSFFKNKLLSAIFSSIPC